MRTNTVSLTALFGHRRGVAIFMAALILLSISILALSSMARLSEATQATGKALETKKLAILADSATRIALAEVTEQFIAAPNAADIIYVNATNTSAGQANFKMLNDTTTTPATPILGYRARANLLLVGDGSAMPPGTDIPLSSRNTCYDIVVDTVEVIGISGTNVQSDLGSPATGYYFGQMKSVGVTSCFRKR